MTQLLIAGQISDVSFNNNNWSTASQITSTGNEVTITGDQTKFIRTQLDVPVPTNTTNVYFVAEIELTNIVSAGLSYQLPKMKVYEGGGNTAILAYNLTDVPEGKFLLTGMLISRYDKLALSQLRIEFSMQNCSGTMKVKNPQLLDSPPASSVSFPFDLPSDPTCNLSIDTSASHNFENDLLSANSHFTWASYDWRDQEVIDLINTNFPMTNMRFPAGTVGNFYNYGTDGFYNDQYGQLNSSAVKGYNSGFTFGYAGYKNLCIANTASSTLMFNVISDDVNTAKNRLQSRLNDGLNIKWIEMGNENYYDGQNYGNVSDLANYISHTKNLTQGLKQIKSDIKTAVNIDHDNYANGGWNDSLSKESYYDAAVMHPYVSTNTFILNELSAYKMFSSYKITKDRFNEFQNHFGSTPLICTEWNILSKGTPVNFIQTLSIADMFFALEEGNVDGIVQQAGIHMLYHSDNYGEATLSYHNGSKMVLTANGIAYSSLFRNFKNKDIYDGNSTSEDLITGLPSVNAKAIDHGDSIKIFAVNKLPITSPFNFSVNGQTYSGKHVINSFHIDITEELTVPYNDYESAWTTETKTNNLEIPAYSITVISIAKNDISIPTAQTTVKNQDLKLSFSNQSKTGRIINFTKNQSWSIFNTNGQLVQTGKDDQFTINSKGVYTLKIDQRNFKFIVH